jgi:D-xylose 1-dehydrogenase (NADP+, D-xylono-1,5-lactone-forming)
MNERVRWGVLGNATIARVCVIPAIQKSRNGTVVAMATRSPETAHEVVRQNGISRLYDNYADLLNDPGIDAVYVPLPNHLHRSWTLAALAAGKPVLCEKPLACNAMEADEMSLAAAASGLPLMEALMYRFHPRSRRIRQMVRDGAIGTLRMVRTAFCFRIEDERMRSGDNFRLNPATGGGALLDVGCYGVSLARWLFDSEPLQVQAQADVNAAGIDVNLLGSLAFAGGGLASLEVSFVSALQQTYSVIGNKGAIDLPHDAFIPWEKEAVFRLRGKTDETGKKIVIPGADEYRLMVEHFADVVRGAAAPAYPIADSVANLAVLDALAEAVRSGRSVTVA